MSYYNPRIYNRNNLHEQDRKELDFWYNTLMNVIDNSVWEEGIPKTTLDKIKHEDIEQFSVTLKKNLGYEMNELMASILEGYGEELKEQVSYEDYLYL